MNNRNQRGRYQQRDVKSRTMSRFRQLDEDIGSQYDYEEEDNIGPSRPSAQGRNVHQPKKNFTSIINRHLNRGDNNQVRTIASGSGRREPFHRVTVKNAQNSKEHVMKLLSDSLSPDEKFQPIAPRTNRGDVEFYLDNAEQAESIGYLSRRISDKNNPNIKFTIYINKVPMPYEPFKHDVKQAIEEVIKSRYSPLSNAIDLSDFGNDPAFGKLGRHFPLFTDAVMVVVSNCIARNFSSIKGISLKNNRLRSLDYTASLVYAAPNVTELDLSSNALSRIEELDRLRGWHIEKVHLENNAFTSRFPDAVSYTSAVHEYFPRVNYLDGIFVNPDTLRLSVEDGTASLANLPPIKLGFCPPGHDGYRIYVENFLTEYLAHYDGPEGESTRKNLMNAYDENATFTYSIQILSDTKFVDKGDNEIYSSYIRSSHNIINESKWAGYRDKIVYKGAMEIAVALSKLPLTTHIKESFVLDFNQISPQILVFSLQGIIRDGKEAFTTGVGDYKFFVRNFLTLPRPNGTMAILSDMLMLTPINVGRMERYNALLKKAAEQQVQV